MNAHHRDFARIPDWLLVLLSASVLLVCLFYTYAAAYLAPHPGLILAPDWVVEELEPCAAKPAWCEAIKDTLKAGDQLLVIGDLAYADFLHDLSTVPFDGYDPGDWVPITFRRTGEEQSVNWQMLGPTYAGRMRRLTQGLPLCIPFWFAGTVVLLLLRPRDRRWWLLISFNYVAAIWLAAGACSFLGVAYASPVQHALAWLGASICFHLHLVVPSSLLRRQQRYFLPAIYATAVVLALLELFQLLPVAVFNLGLLLAVLGSLGLLIFRLFASPTAADRLTMGLMLAGIGLSLGPGILLWVVPTLLGVPLMPGLALNTALLALVVPLLPFFYIYALYKRRLGAMEFRVNRLLSLYSFVLLYATVFVLAFYVGYQLFHLPGESVVFSLAISAVFVLVAPPLYARFQWLVGKLTYGTEHDPNDILRVFSSQISAILDRQALAQLLTDKIAPSLLIRQSALYLLADGDAYLVYARGANLSETPRTFPRIQRLLAKAGQYRPPMAGARGEFDWVRLAISLATREKTLGVWLFGRRDPDDYYPRHDIELLTTLASQVAVASENIQLYERAQKEIVERRRAEERIQASLREKEVLLKEIHHRVKNNLQVISSLLNLQAESIHDPQVLQIFQESRSRVRSMSLVHEELYRSSDLARIDVASYIQSLVVYLFGVYGGLAGAITPNVQVDDVSLNLDEAIPCGLIINELVSNALKYAFPPDGERLMDGEGEIHVKFRREKDDRLLLTVSDNGIGLPPDLDIKDPPSLGLQLVSILTEQLEGTIELDGSTGTTFKITFAEPKPS